MSDAGACPSSSSRPSVEEDQRRLGQAETLSNLMHEYATDELMSVYQSQRSDDHDLAIYATLVPTKRLTDVLADPAWDRQIGEGRPGTVRYFVGKSSRTRYWRFGNDEGFEPLVIVGGSEPVEISEEFRLFHGLRRRDGTQYFKEAEDGDPDLIAIVEKDRVRIRLKEIRQFLAVRQMHLSIQFDCREHSQYTLAQLGLEGQKGEKRSESLAISAFGYGDFGGLAERYHAFSRLFGKRLIPPLPKAKSEFGGFIKPKKKQYVKFIIGVDAHGEPAEYTSDPAKLADFFGANADAPNYLTPVHFRPEVLEKYYSAPSKYSVEDSFLRCGGAWGLQMDNHQRDRVTVWLGDLGRDLPHVEQLHWRSNNIAKRGGVGSTYFKRQILAEFADSASPDHRFLKRYEQVRRLSKGTLGWEIFLPLHPSDAYHLKAIRIPTAGEQGHFDALVLSLTKLLIDSLNEAELAKLAGPADGIDRKGIAKLEGAMTAAGIDARTHLAFFRRLQALRSSGVAHRKGTSFERATRELNVDGNDLRGSFATILDEAAAFLEMLIVAIQEGKFAAT